MPIMRHQAAPEKYRNLSKRALECIIATPLHFDRITLTPSLMAWNKYYSIFY